MLMVISGKMLMCLSSEEKLLVANSAEGRLAVKLLIVSSAEPEWRLAVK